MKTRCCLSFISQVKRRTRTDVINVPDWAVVLKRHISASLEQQDVDEHSAIPQLDLR